MEIRKGIPVSPGVAIHRAVVMDSIDQPVPRRNIGPSRVKTEQQRLEKAVEESRRDIQSLIERTSEQLGPDMAKIFDFHLGMLDDRNLLDPIRQTIARERVTAEYAVSTAMRRLADQFLEMDNPYLRDRVKDVTDLQQRVIGHLVGEQRVDLSHLQYEAVVVAHDLTPSQTAGFDRSRIRGLVTDAGGRTSHTAILAHALGIPAVVGLGDITNVVNPDDTLIIDGNRGVVIVNPDAAQLLEYRQYLARLTAFEDKMRVEIAGEPAITTDGQEITLWGNIEFPYEIPDALARGAAGIGLYRTEFLFLSTNSEPTEQQQYEAYVEAIEALGGRPLTIRTLDLGADKIAPLPGLVAHAENNPFLGCRSIRLCLQNLPLFENQLRAILRASVKGPVRVMFPLISNVMELRQAKMVFTDVMEDLEERDIPFATGIPVGIMIEVPSAALQAPLLCREVDFVSIGTNDLIQYTLAVDRSNERIASLYSGGHPAVLQLIRDVVRAGVRAKVDVSLCGEMGGEPEFVMLLVGLGLRHLSVTPPAIPEVKKIIRSVSLRQCQRVARRCMSFESEREVTNFLREEIRRILPEVINGGSLA